MSLRADTVALEDPRWEDLVLRGPHTLFQTPRWCRTITSHYGFNAAVLALFDGARLVGGLPFAEISDILGHRKVAFPFSDVCDAAGEVTAGLAELLAADTTPWKIRSRTPYPLASNVQAGLTQSIDLRDEDVAYARKRRQNAAAFTRAGGTVVRLTGRQAIRRFYAVFATFRARKLGMIPPSRAFFESIAAAYLPQDGYVLIAQVDGRDAAALLMLADGDTLYMKYGGYDVDLLELRPWHYIFYKAYEQARQDGHVRLDLGNSSNPGLIAFKQHFGAGGTPFYRSSYGSVASRSARAAGRAIGVLTSSIAAHKPSVALANAAGSVFYRYFV